MAIFLDRDGVINVIKRGKWINHENDFMLYPYTIEAMKLLCETGEEIFIVTNQSGVARGTLQHSQYYAITSKMLKLFEADGIKITRVYECLHNKDGSENCNCRKPGVGMIRKAIADYNIEGNIWIVGDSASDIKLAMNARALSIRPTPIMVQTGLYNANEYNRAIESTTKHNVKLFMCQNLLEAAKLIYSSYSGSS